MLKRGWSLPSNRFVNVLTEFNDEPAIMFKLQATRVFHHQSSQLANVHRQTILRAQLDKSAHICFAIHFGIIFAVAMRSSVFK